MQAHNEMHRRLLKVGAMAKAYGRTAARNLTSRLIGRHPPMRLSSGDRSAGSGERTYPIAAVRKAGARPWRTDG